MSLNELRESYTAGNISKLDYLNRVRDVLFSLEDIKNFMENTDINTLNIHRGGGVTCGFKSVPIEMFFDAGDISSPAFQAMSFFEIEGDYSRKLIETLKTARVFFDIGANVGYYSLICGKTNPEAKIYSFEPIFPTYMKFLRNVALNSCTNIFPYNFGFSDSESTQEMFFDSKESGAGSLRNIRGNARQKETAHFIKLDDFSEKYCVVPDLMKIDVEGSELFVLRGAEKVLRENSPVIFVEILRKWCRAFGHSASDVVDVLHDYGYVGHVVRNNGLEIIERITEETEDTNFVFTKKLE